MMKCIGMRHFGQGGGGGFFGMTRTLSLSGASTAELTVAGDAEDGTAMAKI